MAYATIKSIREQAGAQNLVKAEKPDGLINGVNAVFITKRKPIVDNNADDAVTVADVVAMVNDAVVVVSAIDGTAGQITLQNPPANGTILTVDYATSWASDSFVAGVLTEAESWVNTKIGDYVTTPLSTVPGIITTATRLYAGGLLMTRREGASDTTELLKTGRNFIEMARDLLNDYIKDISEGDEATDLSTEAGVKTDGNIFRRETDLDGVYGGDSPDDHFMRRNC